jgi:type IV pilus assembly protein PilY1
MLIKIVCLLFSFCLMFINTAFSADVPGCSVATYGDYSSGFVADEFVMTNITVTDPGGYMQLETGYDAIDPNNIVIPYEQEVSVNFLHEGAGFTQSDFGWILASEGIDGEKHEIYTNVNDNEGGGVGDGVLDSDQHDNNLDGHINVLDNRRSLGTFAANTELVFYLKVDDRSTVFYTKTEWNPDTFPNATLTKEYLLGKDRDTGSDTLTRVGWMDGPARARASTFFGLNFDYNDPDPLITDDIVTLEIAKDEKYQHVIVGVPDDKPNEWLLGWEDLPEGGDNDHNDLVFLIERKTGGVAELSSDNPISPDDPNAYYTAVELEVWDDIPSTCSNSNILYEASVNNGADWITISNDDWDTIRSYALVDGVKTLDESEAGIVSDWTPGSPQYTYRKTRIDVSALGYSGNQLIWKATLTSNEETCQPRIIDVDVLGRVATNGEISRSSPVIQGNVLYNGSYETPAIDWTEKTLRGHLTATRIYDSTNPNQTDYIQLWDAGQVLTDREPSDRDIYYPSMDVTEVPSEQLNDTADGAPENVTNGTNREFSGTLLFAPLVATTLEISDGIGGETFTDVYINTLKGSNGGEGTINRYTGEFKVIFASAPTSGVPINATYSYYDITSNTMVSFTGANVTNGQLALDDTTVVGEGSRYDLNDDHDFDHEDGDWLVEWTRGYSDGSLTPKEWLLEPIDHSTPALITAPSRPYWYFGADVDDAERTAFDVFKEVEKDRRSVVLVGSRAGMLHAFDAGNYRWGDNDETDFEENRGYFEWSNDSSVTDWWSSYFTDIGFVDNSGDDPPYFGWKNIYPGDPASGDEVYAPDYGTGEELWSFIPANLVPRLKNNLLLGEDRSYVDASTAISDVYIDKGAGVEWRTVALVAQGNGGDSVFCLDVTDPINPSFLWEFADPELFRSRSSPAVSALGRVVYNKPTVGATNTDTKWAAFFVSGRNFIVDADDNPVFPSIYIINIEDGSILEKVVLDDTSTNVDDSNAGGVPSGQPAVVDSNGNGYIDRAYIGTDKGYLYKVILPDDPNNSAPNGISVVLINTDFAYDSDGDGDDDTTIDEDQRYHPIYASPSVVVENGLKSDGTIDYNVRIFFGTGDSPYQDDEIVTDDTKYHFFAYNDKEDPISTDASDVELEWSLELPAGERIFASAFASAGSVYFGTATGETEDPCEGPNEGRIYAFSYDGTSLLSEDGVLGKEVGDIFTAPLVEDEHIYIKSTTGGLQSFGAGTYNNEVIMGGLPFTRMQYWREIF